MAEKLNGSNKKILKKKATNPSMEMPAENNNKANKVDIAILPDGARKAKTLNRAKLVHNQSINDMPDVVTGFEMNMITPNKEKEKTAENSDSQFEESKE